MIENLCQTSYCRILRCIQYVLTQYYFQIQLQVWFYCDEIL